MLASELVLTGLPGSFILCERIDPTPLWREGVWAERGQEEAALGRLQGSWLYDAGKRTGDEQGSAQETPDRPEIQFP
ncbi:hypothetical protein [Streptomyces diastatochromogenes]|uniref:hypothetical protein n=1 Tax=Streptomyces diastatochromogenes TaxID=42236 RepID=UPI00142DAE7E|nr:hypothetical protein [Streptomyces diastatochromogenes]MCZ0991842.1 hypothetical protein [Streptomyces diastatochromogenes]